MDDLTLSGEELRRNLDELEIINNWLGGHKVVLDALEQVQVPENHTLRIADIGCGGGDTLKSIARWARSRSIIAVLEGIDANSFMVQYAKDNCIAFPEISISQHNVFSEAFAAQKYDVVVCSLFCHHFTDAQLVQLFSQLYQQARQKVIINDLHRHWLAYYSIKYITAAFSGSRLVKNDAPLSVWRAFKRAEIEQLVQQADIPKYTLKWMWAFRWQLVLEKR